MIPGALVGIGQNSFTQKDLQFTFTMAGQNFTGQTGNSVTISGLRAMVTYTAEGNALSSVTCQIYGISLDIMNQLTTLQGDITTQFQNTLTISTIDGDVSSLLFSGTIYSSWASFENMPDVYMHVQAGAYFVNQVTPVTARSYAQPTTVDTIFRDFANALGRPFANNGVNVTIPGGLYLKGTVIEQANRLAKQAGCYWSIESGALTIWPRNGSLPGDARVINSQTGMIGYPAFDNVSVTVQMLYKPYTYWGSLVRIESSLPRANGEMTIIGLSHHLSSNMPDGPWFSIARCSKVVSALGQI